jgi:hypothetical protein
MTTTRSTSCCRVLTKHLRNEFALLYVTMTQARVSQLRQCVTSLAHQPSS